MRTTTGEQQLTVLGEFKPFGLIAESFDGKPLEDAVVASASSHKYDYFLFNPQIARERDEDEYADSVLSDRSDHELFFRGNRIIWSAGSRVYKRFTLPSSVIMACWCRLGDMSEAVLCVLHTNSLTVYSISGEITSIPLPQSVTSIWPLPYGLLLEQASEGSSSSYAPSLSPSLVSGACDFSCIRGDNVRGPYFCDFTGTFDQNIKGDTDFICSHLILRDPLEEPQCTYIEERGKLNIMKDFDERTIWTSDQVPLMASYNKGKMQHSVWVVEAINSKFEEVNISSSNAVPAGVSQNQFSFRRIWQAKGAHSAACKVFLATDDDATPVICFHLQEQKKLLAVRLQSDEINNEILFDIKPDMSWTIPAIAAAPVTVTRPSIKIGVLSYTDIIVLSPENILLLYSGKQCLLRYMLPTLSNGYSSMKSEFPESASGNCKKIIGLTDPVEERVNIVVNSGQMFRCVLRRSPSCALTNDCITAMAEGLKSSSYNQFLLLLWGNGDPALPSKASSGISLEWTNFCSVMMQMCQRSTVTPQKLPLLESCSSWEFLINSTFHNDYKKLICVADISSGMSIDVHGSDSCESDTNGSQCPQKSLYYELLVESLDSLHALYESLKLDNLRRRDAELLSALLCSVADFLGETNYLDHYIRDFPSLSKEFGAYRATHSQKHPPNLFRWLENCLRHGCQSVNIGDIPLLLCKDGSFAVSWARKIVSFYSLLFGANIMGKKLSSGVYCNVAPGSSNTNEELTVLAMVGERFGLQQLDLLPSGVSLPLRHALDKCRESSPTDWPAAAYVLIGRQDLAMSCQAHSCRFKQLGIEHNFTSISMSTPYMLQLHPVTIPSTFSDTIGLDNGKFEDADSVDGSVTDGMEHIFNSSTQLQYGRDLRLNEVRRVLCSARPVAIQMSVNPGASDQDIQQAQLWHVAQRTTALPFGRGAFTLATIHTLLTEAFTVPKLILAGRLPSQQNATVNLDPNVRNIQELKCWPEFHNAVAAGLRLAPLQGKMSRPWIAYNRPEEPNVTHAGLLLALGLHGYLRVLNISDIYQYCQQEHESTTVGLLLGLAASYRGTMDPPISKSLYVHLPSRHPSSYPELEIPTVMQSAALLSVGLLYEGSVHPQTMQILLGEIGRRSGGDSVLEREGYAVSAGFAVGLVALGRGEDAFGFMGSLVDRLFYYIGGKEPFNEKSFFWTPLTDERNRATGKVMDETAVNVDVTAPGAIIALALIFMKTESDVIVSRLPIPRTRFELQYVRPDFIMLRVIARNLIMWSRIHASKDWMESQIPETVRNGLRSLRDGHMDIDDTDVEAFVQAYVNILTGACISLGLRYAGTRNGHAQELLYEYAVYFLNEIKPVSAMTENEFPNGLANYVDRGTLEICLHLIVLSLSVVMAGSGHLQTFRLLRFLRCRNCPDGHSNYGIQMAVSLAIGFLFLGGGMRTFSTSTSSIAALLITLYPRLPTGPNDNRCHLQAFRHLYVLATEARWIQTVDVDSGLPVHVPLEVTIKETENYAETSFCEITPCVIPERAVLKRVRVCGPRYWSRVIEVIPEDEPWWSIRDGKDPFKSGMLYVKRKVGACSYVDDPIGCQSLLSRALHKVFGLTSMRECDPTVTGHGGPGSVTVDQLVSTFSSDPSLIAFAQLCCDPSWTGRSDGDFQEFCLQVLFECVSKDRPALLQVYLSLYATIESMAHQVTRGTIIFSDSFAVTNLKLALTYIEALLGGNLNPLRGGIIQLTFLGCLKKRVDEILNCSQGLEEGLRNYVVSERWPGNEIQSKKNSLLIAWYLQWYRVPTPSVIRIAVKEINGKLTLSSSVPLLRLLFPSTHITAINDMDKFLFSSQIQR